MLIGASVLGCGTGSVYVGVAVPGPYYGYPYAGPYRGGWGGYPYPRYPEEDVDWEDLQEAAAQVSTDAVNDSIATAPIR